MAEQIRLRSPWLVAVWPGMGQVALNAGYYLLAKLNMHVIAEFDVPNLFEIDHVGVANGLIQPIERPRNLLFGWSDPTGKRDLVVFLGEAQPPIGKYPFCHGLIQYAANLGVERVFTFAAMATDMAPSQPSRVFGAATDADSVEELKRLELELLTDGNIGGLNGVLLGAAAANKMHGTCLLGEMPHIFSQLPYPKASKAILEVFSTVSGIELDFTELNQQVEHIESQLDDLVKQVEQATGLKIAGEDGETDGEPAPAKHLSDENERQIEELFEQARQDRTKAFELKQKLDRLGVFNDYEDRFLDLFKKAG